MAKKREKAQITSNGKLGRYSTVLVLIVSLLSGILTIGFNVLPMRAAESAVDTTLSLGTATGMPGEQVTLAVSQDTTKPQ